jgi:hypothetical protein
LPKERVAAVALSLKTVYALAAKTSFSLRFHCKTLPRKLFGLRFTCNPAIDISDKLFHDYRYRRPASDTFRFIAIPSDSSPHIGPQDLLSERGILGDREIPIVGLAG